MIIFPYQSGIFFFLGTQCSRRIATQDAALHTLLSTAVKWS
jgi:hypothetical protein